MTLQKHSVLGAHLRKKQHRKELAESKKRIQQDGNRGLCCVNGQNYFNYAEIMNKT